MKPQVSVIIPVYNTSEYLNESLGSIVNQTLHDLEIIIVNDGSTDNSIDIIRNFSEADNRIKVLNQVNSGQSVARNNGLQMATGEYIYFFDSDDILDTCALESLYCKIKNSNSDIVFFDAETFIDMSESNSVPTFNYIRCNKFKDCIYRGSDILRLQLENGTYSSSPCLVLIKHEFLKQNKLTFYPGIVHEDELFTFLLYLKSQRVSLFNTPFFKRRVRGNSTMTSGFTIKRINGYITVCKELKTYRDTDLLLDRSDKELINDRIRTIVRYVWEYTCNTDACNYVRHSLLEFLGYRDLGLRLYVNIRYSLLKKIYSILR